MAATTTQQTTAPRRRSAQVPGQALGYSLQVTRATARLLAAAPGTTISFEVLDDVSAASAALDVVAEQTKSAITHNPLADRAVDFWKTMSNWVDAVRAGRLDPSQTRFDLYVSRNVHGPISDRFAAASNMQEALASLDAACNELWGSAPKRPKRNRVAAALKPFLEKVFSADRQLVAGIIERFSIIRGRGVSAAEIDDLVRTKWVSENKVEFARNYALGWVKQRIDGLTEQGKNAAILSDEFHHVMTAFVQKYDHRRILFSIAQVTRAEALAEFPVRVYVRQLELIDASFDDKLRAATDFLSSSADRAFWEKKGLVFEKSFDEFEDGLKRQWEIKRKTRLLEDSSRAPTATGHLIYADCSGCTQTIEGLEVPPHFVPGSFHTLADRRDIGWHPDFRNLLAPSSALVTSKPA
jgi:hypothetical protein